MKLPKAIKAKWLKALRTGGYKQTTKGTMYDPISLGFCCLGVLQHCTSKGMVEVPKYSNDNDFETMPSEKFWKSIKANGYQDRDCYGVPSILAYMNDHGKKFTTIANWIDKNIEGY